MKLKVRSVGVVLVGFVVIGAGLWLWNTQLNTQNQGSLGSGAAPEFSLPAMPLALPGQSQRERSLAEFKGQPVVLHFWASWCPPCLDEIQEWVQVAKQFEGQPLRWVAISLDTSAADAEKFLPSNQLPKNVVSLLDTKSRVSDQYGSYQFPETYLLSPSHQIVAKWVGPQDWQSEGVKKALQMLMAVQPSPSPVK